MGCWFWIAPVVSATASNSPDDSIAHTSLPATIGGPGWAPSAGPDHAESRRRPGCRARHAQRVQTVEAEEEHDIAVNGGPAETAAAYPS